jgi:hypothetical protein
MTNDIEDRLRRAYLAEGGSESAFETVKGSLISQYRHQATIAAALEEARTPPNVNDLIRHELHERRDQSAQRILGRRLTHG